MGLIHEKIEVENLVTLPIKVSLHYKNRFFISILWKYNSCRRGKTRHWGSGENYDDVCIYVSISM